MARTTKKTTTESEINIKYLSLDGKQTGDIAFPASLYNETVKVDVFSQYVRMYLANQRQGTHSTLTRSEINATTKKIYRQKGTGNARHGSKRAPIFVGGGVTFAVKPRDYTLKLNKAQKRSALIYSLTQQLKENRISALHIEGATGKTKQISDFLKSVEVQGKVLFVVSKLEKTPFVRSVTNIEKAQIIDAKSINPYIIANNNTIIFEDSALKEVENHFHV